MAIIALVMVLAIISGSGFLIRHEALSNMREEVDEALEDIADGEWDEIDYYEDGLFLQVFDREGDLIGGRDYEDFPPLGQDHGRMVEDGRWFVYSQEGRGGVVVRALMPASEVGTYMSSVQLMALVFLPLILFLSALGGYFIVRRSFRPADRAVEAAGQIVTSNDLSKRIGLGDGDDEIHSMTKAFDAMLDRLEEAFRKEKQFTSDASHELRTPLSVIKAECEYASKHVEDPEKMRQVLSSIDRQAGRMTSLVSELLSLARADKGTLSPKYEDFCLSELGEMVLDSFEEEAENKGLKLIAKCEDGLCVQADQGMLTRVMINLISNAVQYTDQWGWVMLRTERDGDWALISVEDNGIGIGKEHLERIWDRFFQVDPSRSSSSSGAGLGLPIVKAIIEAHKGSVSVESQPGKGSTFTVRIPLVKGV